MEVKMTTIERENQYREKPFYQRSIVFLGFIAAGLEATVALNAPTMILQASIEALLDQPKQEYVGRIRQEGRLEMINTHGHINYWTIELPDGTTQKVCDSPRILEGKLWANISADLKVGTSYTFLTIGSDQLGYTLLNAQEKK